jgi:phospholipid/cholesterol/gamma-HCH transport system permease protein
LKKNETLDQRIYNFFDEVGQFSLVSVEILKFLFTGRIHFRNTMQQMAFVGTDSLPIVLLTGMSIGMVFALQVTGLFQRYGATSMVGAAVSVAIVRELAPLFTGVVIAGRIGAAITAEIGSMKVTEQIDALTAMAVNPLRYLAVPRVLSCLIMVPLLTIVAVVIGIIGGMIVAVYGKGVILASFLESTQDFLGPVDIFKCMLKAAIFGMIVSLISCYKGVNTGEGAQGVGISTTGAVVLSLISIFIANYLLSMMLFTGKM